MQPQASGDGPTFAPTDLDRRYWTDVPRPTFWTDDMTRTDVPATGYEVWFRPHHVKGARRKKVAAVATHAEAIARVNGRGDWWITPVKDDAVLGEPNDAVLGEAKSLAIGSNAMGPS